MEALSRVLGERIGEHIVWLIVTEDFMTGMLSLQRNYKIHAGTGECLGKIGD